MATISRDGCATMNSFPTQSSDVRPRSPTDGQEAATCLVCPGLCCQGWSGTRPQDCSPGGRKCSSYSPRTASGTDDHSIISSESKLERVGNYNEGSKLTLQTMMKGLWV